MKKFDLPIVASYRGKATMTESFLYEHLNSKDFIDSVLDESCEPVYINEAFPFLIPILTTVGPKLAQLGMSLVKSGVLQKGVKAVGQVLAQNAEGKNLIAAAKQAANAAGKSFTPEVLSQLIAGLVNGDVGQNSTNLNNDKKAMQQAQTIANGGNNQSGTNQQQNDQAQQQNNQAQPQQA